LLLISIIITGKLEIYNISKNSITNTENNKMQLIKRMVGDDRGQGVNMALNFQNIAHNLKISVIPFIEDNLFCWISN